MEYYKNKTLKNIFYTYEGVEYEEEWRGIPGYEDLYQCSTLGRFKSLPRYRNGAWGNKVLTKTRILVPTTTVNGYLQICLTREGVTVYRHAHIWIGITFIPNPHNKPEINHTKGNKKDNRVFRLEWNTPKENGTHAIETGLNKQIGDRHHGAKLTNRQVMDIFKSKLSNKELSIKYNVRPHLIGRIKRGDTWGRITSRG